MEDALSMINQALRHNNLMEIVSDLRNMQVWIRDVQNPKLGESDPVLNIAADIGPLIIRLEKILEAEENAG